MFPFYKVVAGVAVVVISAGIGVASEKLGASDTPVAYYNCDGAGKECFLEARFTTVNLCEKYLARQSWRCDTTTPGKADCVVPPASEKSSATAKCVK
jgi:hypothetical protein